MCDIPAVQPAIRYNLQFSRSQNFRDAEPPRTSEMANRRDAEASKLAVSLMEEYAVGITNLVIAIWRPLLFPVLNRLPNSLGNQASQFHIFHSHDNFKSSRLDWSRSYCGRLQWPCNFLGPVAQRLLVREPHTDGRKAEVASLASLGSPGEWTSKMFEAFVWEKFLIETFY